LAKNYGLISNTGSHPNTAHQDQARLMRNLALIYSQYILLQWGWILEEQSLKKKSPTGSRLFKRNVAGDILNRVSIGSPQYPVPGVEETIRFHLRLA
jgi:hypothetical protein